MTPTLTDEQVVRVLAERLGFRVVDEGKFDGKPVIYWWESPNGRPVTGQQMRQLLTSRDALAPVLEGLSEEEWIGLMSRITGNADGTHWLSFHQMRYALTLPARDLAHAVAAVLLATKEATK